MIIAPGWANLVSRWADHPVAVSNIHTNGSITTATFTAGSRKYFCKAAPTDYIEAVQALRVEGTASTIHRQASAPFHGLLEGHGWSVLLFDHIDGEHPHFYPPESGLALSERIANLIKAPSGEASTSALPPITDRIDSAPDWSTLVDDHPGLVASTAKEFLIGGQRERMRRLDGAHVAHTDIHRGNILVNGQELTIVDWGWAAHAAPWFDQALLGVQLIAAGASTTRVTHFLHTRHIGHPCSADELAAFAVEMGRYWIGRLVTDPAERYLWTLIKTAGCLAPSLGVPEFLTLEQEVQPKLGQFGSGCSQSWVLHQLKRGSERQVPAERSSTGSPPGAALSARCSWSGWQARQLLLKRRTARALKLGPRRTRLEVPCRDCA